MGYSVHLPLPGGTLKVKSESRLRTRERENEVPVWRFGSTYFVWLATPSDRRVEVKPQEERRSNS